LFTPATPSTNYVHKPPPVHKQNEPFLDGRLVSEGPA
jgi:hypothetical protein